MQGNLEMLGKSDSCTKSSDAIRLVVQTMIIAYRRFYGNILNGEYNISYIKLKADYIFSDTYLSKNRSLLRLLPGLLFWRSKDWVKSGGLHFSPGTFVQEKKSVKKFLLINRITTLYNYTE